MANIYRQSQMFRAALIRRERRAATELAAIYTRMFMAVNRELDALLVRLAAERTAGLLVRESQLRTLMAQIEQQATKFTAIAVSRITQTQAREVEQGAEDALRLLGRAFAGAPQGLGISFAQLPMGVIESVVGNLGDGSPLRALFATFGHDAAREISALLVNSIGLGRSVRSIARDMRQLAQQPLQRTLLISRTEVLRAYRQGSISTYMANNDVVKGWRWLSAASERTCIACWMLDGTFHDNSEEFSDHPNGRCTPVPVTRSWAELGIEGMPEPAAVPTGESRFLMLPAESQRRILGAAGYRAWKAGAVELQDFVGVRHSPQWGDSHYHRSLREILGPDAEQYYGKPAEQPARQAA